jgi:O-antigen ligase
MVVLALVTVAISWGALAFGGVYWWAYPPLLVIAALSGLAGLATAERIRIPKAVAAGVLTTMAAVSVQLAPLSASTISRISPATDRMLSDLEFGYAAAVAAGVDVSHPLSVAPGLTLIGLWFLATASLLTLGLAQWMTRQRMRQLAAAIAAIGTVLALLALWQRAASPGVIFGVWVPIQRGDPFGPFVNKNHFAGWMLMAQPLTLGLAMALAVRGRRRGPARDWADRIARLAGRHYSAAMLASVAAFVMSISLLFAMSRSAIASIIAASTVMFMLTRRTLSSRMQVIAVLSIAGFTIAVLAWVGIGAVAAKFEALSDGVSYAARSTIWRDTWRMALDAPLTGVGIRAYTIASILYQTGMPEFHVGAAHSDWLQLIAEGGILVGAPAAVLIGALVVEAHRRFREHRLDRDFGSTFWIRAGAATGIIAIALQSLVEFSLQMPGNTVLFAVMWALVIAPTPQPAAPTVAAL